MRISAWVDHVEDLVKEGLEDQGFTVKRTRIGSDFEIEYDLIRRKRGDWHRIVPGRPDLAG